MITEVARAHIEELHRVAARQQRAAGLPSTWRRLMNRYARRS